MIKLDVKDRKLLYYLSKDARTSDTQLSRKIKLSKTAIKHRVERFEKLNIIKKFTATLDHQIIGFTNFTLLLRFNDNEYRCS